MRVSRVLRPVGWAVAVAALGVLLAVPAQAAQRAGSASRTISLVSTTVNFRAIVDRAPKNTPSKGDVLREESILRNHVPQFGRGKGANVGSDVGIYTILSVRPVRMSVKVTAKLPGGTLRGTATVRGADTPTIRVVGGTGDFANARGTGEVRDHNGSRLGVLNIYRLQVP
jgi:hypothetical protein